MADYNTTWRKRDYNETLKVIRREKLGVKRYGRNLCATKKN